MWIGETSFRELMSFAFAPDGATIFTGDDSGRVLAWNRQTGECDEVLESKPVLERQAVWALTVAAGGTRLFVPQMNQIRVFAWPGGKSVGRIRSTSYYFPRVRSSADGRSVIAVSGRNTVGVWDATALEPREAPGPLGRLKGAAHAAFVADDTQILVVRRTPPEVTIWDAQTGEPVRELPTGEIEYPERPISVAGRAFAVRGATATEVEVYDLLTGDRRPVVRHERPVAGLALHPGGNFLAVTDGVRDVSLWDTTTGAKVAAWNWRIGKVRAVAFAPDGLTCAVASAGKFAVFDVDV